MNLNEYGDEERLLLSIRDTSRSHLTQHRVIALVLAVLLVAGSAAVWHWDVLQRLSDRQQLISELRTAGPQGPLLCIFVQFVQVVIFVIPGEITQFAAGYVFGTWKGFLFSIIGIVLGSAFNFYFAQMIGRPALERIISPATMKKVDDLLNGSKAKSAMFLLFLIPGTPKDALCYGAGFSNLSVLEFAVISGLARSPALFASVLLGSQASRSDYDHMLLTGAMVLFAFAGYYLYERRRKRSTPALPSAATSTAIDSKAASDS